METNVKSSRDQPADIDEDGVVLHLLEHGFIEDPHGIGAHGSGDNEEVALGQELVEGDILVMGGEVCPGSPIRGLRRE